METRGAVDIANVDQALYRPDLGFKMTNTGYNEYKKGEGLFGKAYEEVISSNTSALQQNQSNLKTAQDYLSSTGNESIDKWYNEAASGWTPVRVTAGYPMAMEGYEVDPVTGKTIQARNTAVMYTKLFPKEVVDQLYGQMNKEGSYLARWYGNELYIGDQIAGAGRYGVELANSLNNTETQIKSAFYDKALPKYQELQANVAKAGEQVSALQSAIGASQANITEAQQQIQLRDTTKEAYKQQYTESKAARQALFAPLAKPEETL